jgi:tRNA pseudouridine38-40 synthase
MNTYRITVAYDGTAYRGWQRQENTELTVQGILERRISEIVGKKMVVRKNG